MKKIFTVFLTITFILLLTGCGNKDEDEKEKAQLDNIKADQGLVNLLYNEVCFNVYKIGTSWNKTSYKHSGVDCYYINVNDYNQDVEDVEMEFFDTHSVFGILDSDLTKIGSKYGANEFNVSPNAYKSLLPICHVNDKDTDPYCLSTYWITNNGVTDNYAIIHFNE